MSDELERYLRARMEAILDTWLKVEPDDRKVLLREKLRVEQELEDLYRRNANNPRT